MNEPTPQTLDEILAAGNAILAQQRQARLQELEEQEARQERIHEAILDAAKSYLPAAVMEFAVVKQDEEGDEPYIADILLTIPNALPIDARFRNIGMDHADPESWKPIEGQRECLRILNEGWTRPIFALPAVLALARERYAPPQPVAPQPEPKPEPPAPVGVDLYQGLINMLDRAALHQKRLKERGTDPAFDVAWVTAHALVGICVNLEDIAMTLGERQYIEVSGAMSKYFDE